MFALTTFVGNPLTREWAEARAKWEPMYEITQIKGDGEAHPSRRAQGSDERQPRPLPDHQRLDGREGRTA